MHIKLTEYVRATTLTLNIKDAPMTALPLIKDAFAKLATDLEEMMGPDVQRECGVITWKVAPTDLNSFTSQGPTIDEINAALETLVETPAAEKPRRGRPPKMKTDGISPEELRKAADEAEPTPLEQAIADAEGQDSQGESTSVETAATPEATEVVMAAGPTSPVSDFDMNSYLAKVCNQAKGAAYKETIYEMAKQFVEEGAVPRPSNIKGDDKRWAFIKAVETDSGVKYVG